MPSSPWATWNNFHADLEKNFVFVHWDQRGAGKSYSEALIPEDMHLENFVSDTLELTDQQKPQLKKIVADGHAAWRAWFKENHEKVDAYVTAIRKAKESGDKEKLKKVRKEKKAFMHTAPSLLRQPEPVRKVLTEDQRKPFDERLQKLKEDLHRPAEKRSSE